MTSWSYPSLPRARQHRKGRDGARGVLVVWPAVATTEHAQVPQRAHEQVWIKVNAPVDAMIRGVVENDVPELETIESCQGPRGQACGPVVLAR